MRRGLLTMVVCLLASSHAWAANKPPTISGNPVAQALVGESYSFKPQAKDPEGKVLKFTIKRKPAWAAFNAKTGRLTGKPAAAHVGTYRDISISVSDGKSMASLPAFEIDVSNAAGRSGDGSVTLSWTPPTENTNGSVLNDLLGYRIYYGRSANQLNQSIVLNNPGLTRYVVEGLTAAKWHFAMTAVSRKGGESTRTQTVSRTVS